MLIIINKNTKKVINNMGTNSLYPDGNIPNVILKENEETVKFHDDSDEAKAIMEAFDYSIEEEGEEVKVKVHKTKKSWHEEVKQTNDYKRNAIKEELSQLDVNFIDARLIEDIIEGNTIKQEKLDIIARKKELRQQLQALQGGDS